MSVISLVLSVVKILTSPWLYVASNVYGIFIAPVLSKMQWAVFSCTSMIYRVVIIVSLSVVLLWISVFLYGSFYSSYVPTVSHRKDVNLVFRADCEISGGMCTFPRDNITLGTSKDAEVLRRGQSYRVALELDMPETPVNQQLGMFMVELSFYTYFGETTHKASRAVSSMLRYKSYLLQVIETVFYLPLLLLGYSEQKQLLEVELFPHYFEDPYKPTVGAVVEVQSRNVHIYKAALYIHAKFSGLRYWMYEWPIISSIIGTSTIFCFLTVIVLLSVYNFESSSTSQPATYTSVEFDDDITEEKTSSSSLYGTTSTYDVEDIGQKNIQELSREPPDGSRQSTPGDSEHSNLDSQDSTLQDADIRDELGNNVLRHRKGIDT